MKKTYIRPATKVMVIETCTILAGSTFDLSSSPLTTSLDEDDIWGD